MDVLKVSLEALLQRATNPQNENIDTVAVEAFCALINKEKDGPLHGVKLLASRMHSKKELEALQTLHILDYAMQKCGAAFQEEIGKFRFLNEMIKLVSPKYLGAHTPLAVKQKVLQLMYLWMLDYPKQAKIKDAYDMLKKQGVIKDVPLSVSADYQLERPHNTIFQDEEKGKLLKKLLQSKNPEDLQAANRLIKTMVKEDEKKAELKSRRISELESVQNNIRLLSEMLDSYKFGVSSMDETELIKELHESCLRMRSGLTTIASESSQSQGSGNTKEVQDEILNEVLRVNDELGQVFDKYHVVMVLGMGGHGKPLKVEESLLDLVLDHRESLEVSSKSNVDVLCDILSPMKGDFSTSSKNLVENDILQPISVVKQDVRRVEDKRTAFEDLDALSETLLQNNLQSVSRQKSSEKIPMNMLKVQAPSTNCTNNVPLELQNFTDVTQKTNLTSKELNLDDLSLLLLSSTEPNTTDKQELEDNLKLNSESSQVLDDLLVDITLTPTITSKAENLPNGAACSTLNNNQSQEITETKQNSPENKLNHQKSDDHTESKVLKLSDIHVDLQSIKPSGIEPIVALNEQNGVALTLHFAKDKPHEDVFVLVVSIANKHESPMTNVLFRAIVPKACKVKLQPPSATDLPACNPFLPPSAITQVMLIANPEKVRVSLKFIVSYNLDDDEMTEMGEIAELPTLQS